MHSKRITSVTAAALIFPAALTAQHIGFEVGIAAPGHAAAAPFGVGAGPTHRGAYRATIHPYGGQWPADVRRAPAHGFIVPAAGFVPTATVIGPGTITIWGPGTATIVGPGTALYVVRGHAAAPVHVVPGYAAMQPGAVFVGGSAHGLRPPGPCQSRRVARRAPAPSRAFGGIGVPAPRCTR